MRRRPGRGQAAVELLALLPLLVLVAVFGWQLTALLAVGMQADARARDAALAARGHGIVTVDVRVDAPVLLPSLGRLRVPARHAVLAP